MDNRYKYNNRRRNKNNPSARAAIAVFTVIALCAAIVMIAVIFANRSKPSEGGIGRDTGTGEVSDTGSESGSGTESSSESESESESESDTGEITPKPPYSGDDKWGTAGLSRDYFTDAGGPDSGGSWYPGKVERDLATGNVRYVWDRHPDTLALLDRYGAIYRKNTDKKVAYLTFDCGFENGNTEKILDALKEKGVRAIFFLVGEGYIDNPECAPIIKRMVDEGHLIGCHTYSHASMPHLSDEEFVRQIEENSRLLDSVLGYHYEMKFYRPPEGCSCERDLYLAKQLGLTTVMWSRAYADFYVNDQWAPADALDTLKKGLHDGVVYLLHAVGSTNGEILGDLIDWIHAEGYTIPRIDE